MTEKNNIHKSPKIWTVSVILALVLILAMLASITIKIDPFFHFHGPVSGLQYEFSNERYINDGIVRHFDYDALITGSSVTENFKASEVEELFGFNTIKVSYSGGYYNEIGKLIERAHTSDNDIQMVIRGLDLMFLVPSLDDPTGVKAKNSAFVAPEYLMNDNPFDDVNYIFNKSVLFNNSLKTLDYTKEGNTTTSFDQYGNWMNLVNFGAGPVFGSYTLGEPVTEEVPLVQEEVDLTIENLRVNVTKTVKEHPETTYYLFFPPYSIAYWEIQHNNGTINYIMDAQRVAIEELLQYPNVKLFSWFGEYDMICNLDNYFDYYHYGEWINSDMLRWMKDDYGLLTWDNYEQYLEETGYFYNSYDYTILQQLRESVAE